MCNYHKNLAIGVTITLVKIILGNPNRLKLPLFFVHLNRLHFDYLAVLHNSQTVMIFYISYLNLSIPHNL